MHGSIPAENESIQFVHDDATLSGEVFVPRGGESLPGLVMLQGSGAAARDNHGYFPPIVTEFVSDGIAVLCYDKPGVGDSTGDWRTRTLRDRAQEALAALEVLRDGDRIDAERVGLWGFSQGGWVAPLAATLSPAPSFAVSVSGPAVPPAEQNVYEVETRLRRDGYGEKTVARGREWAEDVMNAAREKRTFAAVERTLFGPNSDGPWREYWDVSTAGAWNYFTLEDPVTGRPDIDYDPSERLATLHCPLLAIYGAEDAHVPVDRSVSTLERVQASAPGSSITVRVFPDADHGIRIEDDVFAPGFLETVVDWLETRFS